ncbi:MAG: glycosyl transferase [Clostridium sp. Maddingley MBC34-26]|nr:MULTISPECIES: glycosyltransferase family 2 protein [unclassified Clostridium]EKQ55552.1 MAG: glycosyl transferase [Clostridium sp. Maddingley MBC34-26]
MLVNVSIITPVYNVERCIEKTINSIINQSSKDFELLLIDDGSKDKSIEIARGLLEKSDVNYKIITQENSGVSAARNAGIKQANGEYIAFLDSDDYIDFKFVEMMYSKAKETQSDVIYCDYSEVDINGNILVKNRANCLSGFISGKDAALKQLDDDINIGMRSAIYKASIIKENNLLFDSKRKYGEDMVFIVKSLLCSNKITSVNEVLAFYVIWEASVTSSVSLKHLDCYNSYLDLLEYVKSYKDSVEVKDFLLTYKIPYAVAHVFSVLSRDKNFHENLLEFLNRDDVRNYLKAYKIQKFNKKYIRYLIQCKGMLYFPNILLRIFSCRI